MIVPAPYEGRLLAFPVGGTLSSSGMCWKGNSEATKTEGLDPGLEGRQQQLGRVEGCGEVSGLAGGQGLHKEATSVSPRQFGWRLQSFWAQCGGLAAGRQ